MKMEESATKVRRVVGEDDRGQPEHMDIHVLLHLISNKRAVGYDKAVRYLLTSSQSAAEDVQLVCQTLLSSMHDDSVTHPSVECINAIDSCYDQICSSIPDANKVIFENASKL
jgi:hypothetical protein